MEAALEPLISGLPDDISLCCLARVPRRDHHILKRVCKRWKTTVSSEDFVLYRQKHNLHEIWMYAVCQDNNGQNHFFTMDPSIARRFWKSLPGIPSRCLRRQGMCFETLGRKLYLLGGSAWNEDATDEVYCYNVPTNTWEEVIPLPSLRCSLVSTTLKDTLYVTGEKDVGSSSTMSWDTYNLISKTWSSHGHHEVPAKVGKCVTLNSRIYTVHEVLQRTQYIASEYDPSAMIWKTLKDNEICLCWRGPTAVVDGTLYLLDEIGGTKLLMWNDEAGKWVSLGRLSPLLTRPPCQLAVVGRKIFIVGKGLTTVVVDVDVAAKSGGMMTTSTTLPELDPDLLVLTCKTIAI